jgi:hypothetical protein
MPTIIKHTDKAASDTKQTHRDVLIKKYIGEGKWEIK